MIKRNYGTLFDNILRGICGVFLCFLLGNSAIFSAAFLCSQRYLRGFSAVSPRLLRNLTSPRTTGFHSQPLSSQASNSSCNTPKLGLTSKIAAFPFLSSHFPCRRSPFRPISPLHVFVLLCNLQFHLPPVANGLRAVLWAKVAIARTS